VKQTIRKAVATAARPSIMLWLLENTTTMQAVGRFDSRLVFTGKSLPNTEGDKMSDEYSTVRAYVQYTQTSLPVDILAGGYGIRTVVNGSMQ
jgi:hypothetical protein